MATNTLSDGRFAVTVRLVVAGMVLLSAVAFVGHAAAVGNDATVADGNNAVVVQNGQEGPPAAQEAFVVELDEKGDANITWTMSVMNLSDQSEAEVFQNLRSDNEWQQERVDEFESQWQSIVADASEETGREMAVSNTAIEFEEVENKGVIRLSLTWEGLAATSGDELELTAPFVTMTESPWPLYVGLPDGYETATVDAETDPAEQSKNYLAWIEESDLSGFTLAAVESNDGTQSGDESAEDDGTESDGNETGDGASESDGTADGTGPGFGIVAALAGLLGWWRLSARN